MIVNPSLPSGHVIFCDDIRHEVTGKVTFVGTYTNFMYINGSLPIALSKFCMGIVYRDERDSLENVTIKIFMPGDKEDGPSAEYHITPQADMVPPPATSDEFVFREYRMFFEAPGAIITEEGRIRVRAYKGDDVIRLATLTVAVNPDPSGQPPQAEQQPESEGSADA